tara:strand:- start:440 stop:943 length:504 start_codon:yes stop_codon:yes gene_type:complete
MIGRFTNRLAKFNGIDWVLVCVLMFGGGYGVHWTTDYAGNDRRPPIAEFYDSKILTPIIMRGEIFRVRVFREKNHSLCPLITHNHVVSNDVLAIRYPVNPEETIPSFLGANPNKQGNPDNEYVDVSYNSTGIPAGEWTLIARPSYKCPWRYEPYRYEQRIVTFRILG